MMHSRRTSFGFIRRDDQFIPRHAELGALLLDDERSVRPLTGLIRAEHSESFDQEFTRAAVNLFLGVAAERTFEKAVRFCFFLRPGRPGISFGLCSLSLRLPCVSFGLCCFSLGRLGASTCRGGLRLLTRSCGFLFFCFSRSVA
jgi:hypothetical protein